MATDSGFNNQKKKGKAQFQTIHASGSDSYAKQVIPKYLTDLVIPTVTSTISTITDILGKDGQVEFWEIAFVDPHYAMKGDVFRMKATQDDLFNWEFEIVSIVDANTIRVLPISDVKPSPFDNGIIKRWVTANADAEGNPISSSSPIKFVLDGVDTEVLEDTVIPANNRPLPVKLTGFTGDITVTANQLDVSTTAADDSMALGDPISGDLVNAGFNNDGTTVALKVKDDDLNATTTLIEGKLPSGLTVAVDELKVLASGTVDISTLPVSFDAGNSDATTQRVVVASDQANLPVLVKSALINVPHDEIVLTYVGATTDIATVVAKLASVTVVTLTFTYDGSNRLVGVVRT